MKSMFFTQVSQIYHKHSALFVVGLIMLVGVFLRVWLIPLQPVIGDEHVYVTRSAALLDVLGTPLQTTPLDWYGTVPWWGHLSFHDHPPLMFWVRHLFAQPLVLDVLSNVLSILMLYLLARSLLKEPIALLIAALYSVSALPTIYSLHVTLESWLTLLLLLMTLAGVRTLQDQRWWLLWWGAAGLAMLSKYTALATIIPQVVFLFLIHRKQRSVVCWWGIVLFLGLLSPVLIYNWQLHVHVGHLDMQWSHLFGQDTPAWPSQLGKTSRLPLFDRLRSAGQLLTYTAVGTWIATLGISLQFAMNGRWPMVPKTVWFLFVTLVGQVLSIVLVFGLHPRFSVMWYPVFLLLLVWWLVQVVPDRWRWLALSWLFAAELVLMLGTALPGEEGKLPGITVSPDIWYESN